MTTENGDQSKDEGMWMEEYITPYQCHRHHLTKVLYHEQTKYQDAVIAVHGPSGKGLILDNAWQSCCVDEHLYHEPLIHPAMMLQGGTARNVLILGGGEGASLREVLRWSTVENATMVDIDEQVVNACKEYLVEMHQGAFDDPRSHLIIGDALDYVAKSDTDKWDVIISDLSDPIEDGPSIALFTNDFFLRLKDILVQNSGILIVQSGPVSPRALPMHLNLAKQLKEVFPYVQSMHSFVPVFTEPWSYIICAQKKPDPQIDPTVVNQILKEKVKGELKMYDGIAHVGLMHPPKFLPRF